MPKHESHHPEPNPSQPTQDLIAVFDRAKRAQAAWQSRSIKARKNHILQWREMFIEHAKDVLDLHCKENQKPRFEALANELYPIVDGMTFFARHANSKLSSKNIFLRSLFPLRKSTIHHEPYGVVLVISPWNFPLLLCFNEIVVALLSGNAVIHKPSEWTPEIANLMQKLAQEAGMPEGILQTVQGAGDVGKALIDLGPDKISFTGSTKTGRIIAEQAARTFTPVTLELGGKDAMIVCADAEIDHASSCALWGTFFNSGQTCASTERLFVHESLRDRFVDALKRKVETLRANEPNSLDTDLGRITSRAQIAVYKTQLEAAKREGLTILFGGNFSDNDSRLEPTLIEIKAGEQGAIVHQEESFGPIATLSTFSKIEDAISQVNQSPYGLGASILTSSPSLGRMIAKQLDVSMVAINENIAFACSLPEVPWLGRKESGLGVKHSKEAFSNYVKVKHVHVPRFSTPKIKSFWWFPYTKTQFTLFYSLLSLYRKSFLRKVLALPEVLWNAVHFFKKDRRI